MRERCDADDMPHTTWQCEDCGFENSMLDPQCQNPDCFYGLGEPNESGFSIHPVKRRTVTR